jgi:hypothetical protein
MLPVLHALMLGIRSFRCCMHKEVLLVLMYSLSCVSTFDSHPSRSLAHPFASMLGHHRKSYNSHLNKVHQKASCMVGRPNPAYLSSASKHCLRQICRLISSHHKDMQHLEVPINTWFTAGAARLSFRFKMRLCASIHNVQQKQSNG